MRLVNDDLRGGRLNSNDAKRDAPGTTDAASG